MLVATKKWKIGVEVRITIKIGDEIDRNDVEGQEADLTQVHVHIHDLDPLGEVEVDLGLDPKHHKVQNGDPRENTKSAVNI